jgi:DNA-binding NtrC family response regulator
MVKEGDFRPDLFYRINTIVLHVPPLRAHREDIAPLARHFAAECARLYGTPVSLGEDCLAALERMELPGNVRELRGLVERAIALAAPGAVVHARHLQPDARPGEAASAGEAASPGEAARPGDEAASRAAGIRSLRERVEEVQVAAVREALACYRGNRTRAARALGLSRPGLTKMMRRLGIEEPETP